MVMIAYRPISFCYNATSTKSRMDRDLTLEKHLLSRSYTSSSEILDLLLERYSVSGGQKPYLPLVPTEGAPEEAEKEESAGKNTLAKNTDVRPTSRRKISARRDMKVYIKRTLASQRKAVKKLQSFQREHPGAPLQIHTLLEKYHVPRYNDYLPLNSLWSQYILDLLFADQKNPNLNMVLPKLSSADYNGSRLTVLESRNAHLVGLSGIVLYDAQHSFILVVPQVSEAETTISPSQAVGGIRIVAKKGTMFGFDVCVGEETVGFTILGSRFELRAVDRAAKKFKSHAVEDIY